MHEELVTELPQSGFFLGAVNEVGYDNFTYVTNPASQQPWLQDTEEVNAWDTWQVQYRDVVILDAENKKRAVFNLTSDTLYLENNYEELKNTLRHLILYNELPPEDAPGDGGVVSDGGAVESDLY